MKRPKLKRELRTYEDLLMVGMVREAYQTE